jgi:hypothetical protein
MLDPDRRLDLDDFPQAQVYRDHEAPLTYYAVPVAPALSLDDRGRPECRLTLYVKREEGRSIATGGQLSLTTVLALADADIDRIKRAIEESLVAASAARKKPQRPLTIQLLGPDWVSGRVTVAVTPALTFPGQPSIFGRNRCVVTTSLPAEAAQIVREQWQHGLPHGRIVYDMVMRVAETIAASTSVRDSRVVYGDGDVTTSSRAADLNVTGATAVSRPVIAEGPFAASGLASLVTEIDLGR